MENLKFFNDGIIEKRIFFLYSNKKKYSIACQIRLSL